MKFKCIKDFFIDQRCWGGIYPELAFKEGHVYTFCQSDVDPYYTHICQSNNFDAVHYMTRADMSEHFIQVEE
jgi:hypothetical protein